MKLFYWRIESPEYEYPCISRVNEDGTTSVNTNVGLFKVRKFLKHTGFKRSEVKIRLCGRIIIFFDFLWIRYDDDCPDRIGIKTAWSLSGILSA